ncbi:hypothetical protein O9992_00215 [Vibrio lentus]|nr:hypothetical protein [Vibrio lentus]
MPVPCWLNPTAFTLLVITKLLLVGFRKPHKGALEKRHADKAENLVYCKNLATL